jgi:hypothetical protein
MPGEMVFRHLTPHDGFGDVMPGKILREGKLPHDIETQKAPFFTAHLVAVFELRGGAVERIEWVARADELAVLILAKTGDTGEAMLVGGRNTVPVMLEPFERIRQAAIIGVELDPEIAF